MSEQKGVAPKSLWSYKRSGIFDQGCWSSPPTCATFVAGKKLRTALVVRQCLAASSICRPAIPPKRQHMHRNRIPYIATIPARDQVRTASRTSCECLSCASVPCGALASADGGRPRKGLVNPHFQSLRAGKIGTGGRSFRAKA